MTSIKRFDCPTNRYSTANTHMLKAETKTGIGLSMTKIVPV